ETYTPDRDEVEWAKSIEELNEIWRKRVKNDALNLKLAGKEWDKIVETLENRYHRFHKVILQYNTEDVFQIYMNAFGYVVDPHTSYFSPITSENFQIDMSLSLEGIGAQLTSDNDYTKVAQIIAGGPAEKSEQLFEDDRIVGVGQGDDGELIDVIGWRLDDVVQLIRGKKGTTVRLSVLRPEMTPDMQPDLIKIVRDKVKLEERAAKSDILDIEQDEYNFKLGLIDLPSFYIDFDAQRKGETDYKSTTRDVKKLISDLKKENIDGLIIDLRNNGGGSLQEAIDLTGLFIETGPVVQVRNTDGSIEVGEDSNPSVVYDGPLAVIVNRYSASASEIFSGAIQDYGRGIVIGEQTFGKGTVQNLINLKRLVPSTKNKLGELKLTVAKYYRINGSSTQHKGVVPDITFPTVLGSHEYGESSRTSALPWDTIRSSNFKRISDIDEFIPELLKRHNERMKKSIEYEFRLEDIEEYKEARNRKEFSLNEDIRKTERDEREKRKEARDEERQKLAELKLKEKGEVGTTESKIDDFELEESARILADLILQGYS
ncbi:MAG: carboxy terminal-processing peptidase, partial [Melioribacteraceae bacterium]|nr:carboxy terminal-processing peptidase [Melioribacteraceae bacterium]